MMAAIGQDTAYVCIASHEPALYIYTVLVAEDLKIAIRAEAKGWKVQFGRNMNTKYLSIMEKLMEMIDGFTKRLSRPIKDLDDVRQAMNALKELRL